MFNYTDFFFVFSLICGNVCARSMTMMTSIYLGQSPVFVAGGSTGVGFEVVKQLSALGTPVHVLARREDSKAALEKFTGVKVFMGDAMNEKSIQSAMLGCVATISTLGGKAGDGARIDYVGNSNVIEQAGILGVERIILVTSIGCGNTKGAVSTHTYNVLHDTLLAKTKAEKDLQTYTNLDWTIIRPGGLKSDPSTGTGILTSDNMASGIINRADLADLVVKTLGSTTCTRLQLSAIDPSQPSDYHYEKTTVPHKF